MTHLETQLSLADTEVAFSYKTDRELKRAYWLFKAMSNPLITHIGRPAVNFALTIGLPIKPLIRHTVFQQFCGGENIRDCSASISQLGWFGVKTILDYSVESGEAEEAYDRTCEEICSVIDRTSEDPDMPFAVFKITGLGRFDLLEKVAAEQALSGSEEEEYSRVVGRVNALCQQSYAKGVPLLFDAEHSWIQPLIDRLAWQYMLEYNRDRPIIYNTYQLYRNDKLAALHDDCRMAEHHGIFLGAKLVRGAYMELERRRAEQLGYPSPIHADKGAVDSDFDAAVVYCLEKIRRVALVIGTHNEASTLMAAQGMQRMGIVPDHPHVYFSQLLGMSDHLSFNLAKAGYNVAKYVPYGPVEAVMPYLLRRAAENSAVAGQSNRELSLLKQEIMRRKNMHALFPGSSR